MSLAAKLPFRHRYSAGFPGLGNQAVPTDADALDYLDRMAAADGTSVEVGVATAVDAFFRDAKESGVFSALKACCILAGARTLAGALVPVVGTAPTNVANGFVSGDYTRGGATPGLKGDGTSYLDSGRANDDDPQNDNHNAVYVTAETVTGTAYIGAGSTASGANNIGSGSVSLFIRSRNPSGYTGGGTPYTGFAGMSRSDAASFNVRHSSTTSPFVNASQTPASENVLVFARGSASPALTQSTLAFYSIGTSLSLEDLDTAVSNLINRLKFALLVGENPSGLDPDTIAYIVSGYENGSTLQ
jgi:hypothetical protein